MLAVSDLSLSSITFERVASLDATLAHAGPGGALVVIDVPIGLPTQSERACDRAARAALPVGRKSSVFPVPVRGALAALTYEEAARINQQATQKSISKQAFAILPKIREVDTLISPALQEHVRESHPEVIFAVVGGSADAPQHPKKDAAGQSERVALLQRWLPAFDPAHVRAQLGPAYLSRDDIVDAAACLLTAVRIEMGSAVVLPAGDVPRDERGLRMEIVA